MPDLTLVNRTLSSLLCVALALTGACATSSSGGVDPDPPIDMSQPPADGGVSLDVDDLLRMGCAAATGQADRVPLYMHLVLDGSGSMRSNGKWAAAVPALTSIFQDVKGQADVSIGVGLTIFADRNDLTIGDTTAGPYDKMDVPIRYVDQAQLAALTMRLTGTAPNLGTPTYEVLSGQFPLLDRFTPDLPLLPGGKKVLVFITDGIPDPDMPAGENEIPWSLNLVRSYASRQAPAEAIPTFVVGVGPFPPGSGAAILPTFLGDLAVAGGTRATASCDPHEVTTLQNVCYFPVVPPETGAPPQEEIDRLTARFAETINAVRTLAVPCEYSLRPINDAGGRIDPATVNVIFTDDDGARRVVPNSGADGWTYDVPGAPTKVILHGPACQRARQAKRGRVTIVLGCSTVIG